MLKAEPEGAVIERALLQGEVAAGRSGDTATILYTQPSGPLKNRHARVLPEEAAATGVNLVKPVNQPIQIGREGTKAADWLRCAIGPYGSHMHCRSDVDGGCVLVDHWHRAGDSGLRSVAIHHQSSC